MTRPSVLPRPRGVHVAVAVVAAAAAVLPAGRGADAHPTARAHDVQVARDVPRVASYFRVDAGWTKLWRDWRPDLLAADLRHVASLRANTVRAIVSPSVFGYPRPTAPYAGRLRAFVSLAARQGLRVQLTLFDWWYDWGDLRGSRTWARELLAPYVGDPRIASVEVKNELVLKPHTIAWARAMIPFVRGVLRRATPVTISVSGTDPVRQLERLERGLAPVRPDAFDIHYFGGGGERALGVLTRAKLVAAPTPLVVGETGYSSTTLTTGYGGVPRTSSAQEAAQAHFLAALAWAARAAGIPPPGVWTLNDLFPAAVPDRVVRETDPELHYGLFRTDGTAKPAAAVVRAAFSDAPPLAFNEGFEEAVTAEAGAPVPAQWSMQGDRVSFASDTDVARTGRASARITPVGTGSGSFSISPPNGGLRGGERVAVGAWARGADTGGRVFTVVEWLDDAGRLVGHAASRASQPGVTWRRQLVTARAPRRAAYLRVALVARAVTAPVWFDTVTFTRLPG